MDKIIEKLKSVDKKVYIGVGAAVLVVVLAVVGVVLLSGNEPANSDPNNNEPNNEYVAGNENDNATDDDASLSTNDEASSSEEGSSNEDDSSTSEEASQNGEEDKTDNNEKDDTTTSAVQKPTATNPEGDEILGAGSKDQPYLEYPGDDFAVKTAKVPAGKELYYDIYRVGGMYLTINDADAYVICEGTKYTAKNGKVSFKVPNAFASDAVSFQIGNSGSSAKSFTIKFANLKGSFANPEKISKLTGEFDKSLAAGAETGYYYKYNAEKAGTIRFYIVEESKDSILVVTNNRNSAQRTTEADVLTDDNGNEYIEIEVKKGDELIINVGAMPNKRGKYPAVEITWRGEYE